MLFIASIKKGFIEIWIHFGRAIAGGWHKVSACHSLGEANDDFNGSVFQMSQPQRLDMSSIDGDNRRVATKKPRS